MTAPYAANLTNHNPENYSKNASFVYSARYAQAVLALLDPQPGERIVDLGCGTGELTRLIADAVGTKGKVVGVDSSEAMLAKAAASGPGGQIRYLQADIQTLHGTNAHEDLKHSFDKVFSSATLHWCKADPGGAIETVKWLLKPGGSFAYELGGFGNAVGVRSAFHHVLQSRGLDPVARDPWYFPTDRQYETLLKKHGLQPIETGLYPRPTPLPTGLAGWLATFARNTFLADIDDATAESIMNEVEGLCKVDMYWSTAHPGMGVPRSDEQEAGHEEEWELMYVRLRGKAMWSGD